MFREREQVQPEPILVFFSYARRDQTLRDQLENHLSNLKYRGLITTWHGKEISAGEETIEQIDVLWLKGRAIDRAFEIEHTTAVYSGILRMADLLALQPNMDIKLHIVAPESRKAKVMGEIQRPVFTLLEKGPLSDYCTFLPYGALLELAQLKHLRHMSDDVLDEYTEGPE